MSAKVINNRPFNLFLSHAHIDKAIADHIYRWCTEFAKVDVWYDSVNLPPGRQVAAELGSAIADCQSAIVMLSESSLKSGWVKKEWNICISQQTQFPDFHVIPIRIDQSKVPPELESETWIDIAAGGELTPGIATQLLATLHGTDGDLRTIGYPQIYLARGSLPHEVAVGQYISNQLKDYRLRSVRDAPNQKFVPSRIATLMSGCMGVICVLSHRGDGKTSKYFFDEIKIARELKRPVLAIVEEAVTQDLDELDGIVVRRAPQLDPCPEDILDGAIFEFQEDVARRPAIPVHCFMGHSFDEAERSTWDLARRSMEIVSGLRCISGVEIKGNVQAEIVTRIRDATFCIFDISDDADGKTALNSAIEAGIALGAGKDFELVCKGTPATPKPFMFRDREVKFYQTPTELVGLVRKLSLPYRRVVN
jgi:hypothetical protein